MMYPITQTEIFQQAADFQKTVLTAAFNSMELIQNRSEHLMRLFWDQAAWGADRFSVALVDWQRAYGEGCISTLKSVETRLGAWKTPFEKNP